MSTTQAPDFTSYPKVTLAGREYEIRLSILDVISLEKQGIDILRPVDYDRPGADGFHPSILERSFKILAQGIHADPELKLTSDKIAELVGFSGIADVVPKITEAIKKVRAQIAGETEAPGTGAQAPQVQ